MTLKQKLKEEPGFQYVVDSLELMSSVGQRRLLEQEWLTTPEAVAAEHDRVGEALALLDTPAFTTVRHQLMQLHDITGTLRSLHSHILLNEVELLEIKRFCQLYITAQTTLSRDAIHRVSPEEMAILRGDAMNRVSTCEGAEILRGDAIHRVSPEEMAILRGDAMNRVSTCEGAEILRGDAMNRVSTCEAVFALLDPDNTGMPHFYIYDSYDPRLAPLRKALKSTPEDPDLFAQMQDIEKQVLTRLSDALVPHAEALTQALDEMAYLDLLLAKAVQARDWKLTRPVVETRFIASHPRTSIPSRPQPFVGDAMNRVSTGYVGLWNPRLKARCEEQGLRYQPVDIELTPGVTLITGANMAGKTVLLKTVGIAQMMLQFGMYVPASQASMTLVDDVLFCIGDEQNEMNGLSSFASEILKISDALTRAESQRLLILIDEPARTTNPIEGKAIVQSLSTLLNEKDSITLVTTHYSQLSLPCRRLRVRGFDETLSPLPLTPQNINHFMDYSLLPDSTDEAPQEALRIASILRCHPGLIAAASRFIHP